MRPSRRLLVIGAVMLALSALIIATGRLPVEAALALWAVFGAILIADLILTPSGASGAATLTYAAEVFSGETAQIEVDLVSRSTLPRRIRAKLAPDPALTAPLSFVLTADGTSAQGHVSIPARRRGRFGLNALWLEWPSRLGLWDIVSRKRLDEVLCVIPNIRPALSGQIDVAVQSELFGMKENMLRGEGSEFHQLREFTTGMDVRSIDWKRSARHRDLVAKEMRAERNHQIVLALDNGYLMREEIGALPKIDHAVNAALALGWAAALGGDLVGLYAFDAQPRQFLPPQPGRAVFPLLRSQTAALEYQSVETNHTLAMANLSSLLNRRSLIVVFSDFVDTTTAELLVENMHLLNRTHVMVFVTISDPLIDPGHSGAVTTMQDMAASVSAAQMRRERRLVLDNLRRIGVICLETPPDRLTPALVSTYLMIKAQELI
jgi:uncharacterized protein (DUF58 family)